MLLDVDAVADRDEQQDHDNERGLDQGWMPRRCSTACTCLAVLYAAMKGGTMMIHPKMITISERTGLIVS